MRGRSVLRDEKSAETERKLVVVSISFVSFVKVVGEFYFRTTYMSFFWYNTNDGTND